MKLLAISICIIICCGNSAPTRYINFADFCTNFASGYTALHIPDLALSYIENLKNIPSPYEIEKQIDFFQKAQGQLSLYTPDTLDNKELSDLILINYEIKLNLERLELEKNWSRKKPAVIPINQFHGIPFDSAWYIYFLKKWAGANVNPDELYLNGMEEIEHVQQHMIDIRKQTGMDSTYFYAHLNDPSFFIKDEKQVQESFEHIKILIQKNLPLLFNVQQVPDINIKMGRNRALAQTPGYYSDNTFYFNYFDSPYNKRQVPWLFIHEAIPGHHYQLSVAAQSARSPVQHVFDYPSFSEGWAAYAEELGKELGAYQTPYDEWGKWEWDLVRSVRVPLDVGINYYGWNDDKALAFWKKYIPNEDAMGIREINRIKRWPAQVISYKYGAALIMQWRKMAEQQEGDHFDIKAFHDKILQQGSLPWFMVERNIFKK